MVVARVESYLSGRRVQRTIHVSGCRFLYGACHRDVRCCVVKRCVSGKLSRHGSEYWFVGAGSGSGSPVKLRNDSLSEWVDKVLGKPPVETSVQSPGVLGGSGVIPSVEEEDGVGSVVQSR